MSQLGAFCASPLGAFIESPLKARGCGASRLRPLGDIISYYTGASYSGVTWYASTWDHVSSIWTPIALTRSPDQTNFRIAHAVEYGSDLLCVCGGNIFAGQQNADTAIVSPSTGLWAQHAKVKTRWSSTGGNYVDDIACTIATDGDLIAQTFRVDQAYTGGSGVPMWQPIALRDGSGSTWRRTGPMIQAPTLPGRPIVSQALFVDGTLYFAINHPGSAIYRYDGDDTWTLINGAGSGFGPIQDGRIYGIATYSGQLLCNAHYFEPAPNGAYFKRWTGSTWEVWGDPTFEISIGPLSDYTHARDSGWGIYAEWNGQLVAFRFGNYGGTLGYMLHGTTGASWSELNFLVSGPSVEIRDMRPIIASGESVLLATGTLSFINGVPLAERAVAVLRTNGTFLEWTNNPGDLVYGRATRLLQLTENGVPG